MGMGIGTAPFALTDNSITPAKMSSTQWDKWLPVETLTFTNFKGTKSSAAMTAYSRYLLIVDLVSRNAEASYITMTVNSIGAGKYYYRTIAAQVNAQNSFPIGATHATLKMMGYIQLNGSSPNVAGSYLQVLFNLVSDNTDGLFFGKIETGSSAVQISTVNIICSEEVDGTIKIFGCND